MTVSGTGQVTGESDDLGLHATVDRLHIHDLYASILDLMGIDNMALTYTHRGRPERPTINEGKFCQKLVSNCTAPSLNSPVN